MDYIIVLKLVSQTLLVVMLGLIVYMIYEVVRIVMNVRKISDRFMLITDLKGWLSVARGSHKFFKKGK